MQIKLFPDYGHQILFFPLGAFAEGREAQIEKALPGLNLGKTTQALGRALLDVLAQRCDGDREQWRDMPEKPWLRHRFGTRKIAVQGLGDILLYGIWLAVESNLGDASRGYLVDARPPSQEEQEQFRLFQPVFPSAPYVAVDVSKLYNSVSLDLYALLPKQKPSIDEPARKAWWQPTRKIAPPDVRTSITDLCRHECLWLEPIADPMDVDLIVDFGNTRTVLLAIENNAVVGGKLRSICKPIRFDGAADEAARQVDCDRDVIIDSWIVLHEPLFGATASEQALAPEPVISVETGRKGIWPFSSEIKIEQLTRVNLRRPQMFVDLAPVIMGSAAVDDLRERIEPARGNRCFQSSPKRYAWDSDPVGQMGQVIWSMVLNPWNPTVRETTRIPKLAGDVLRFIPRNGADWALDDPPTEWPVQQRPSPVPDRPDYPRSETLTWTALYFIEKAWSEITSQRWRENNNPYIPRRLRNVVVPHPAGWTWGVLDAYRAKWDKAINIFRHAHLRDPLGEGPVLNMEINEGFASQLPIVYSEITRMGAIGENWIDLVGKREGERSFVRIMTIDVGGGTTDVTIMDYRDEQPDGGVNLQVSLLFKDSSSQAGDMLVKAIIEKVLLPTIGSALRGDARRWQAFRDLFGAAHATAAAQQEWARICRLVFVPMVHRWLADMTAQRTCNPATGQAWTPYEAGVEQREADLFNARMRHISDTDLFVLDQPLEPVGGHEALEACVRSCFAGLFRSLAKYVAAFDCDLAIVSGKPSELPAVRDLIETHLPLTEERVIFARDFEAGEWYPLYDRRIEDAKTVTAVGAALYMAIANTRIPGWNINLISAQNSLSRNEWGALPPWNAPNRNPNAFAASYLAPDEDVCRKQILINTLIGRKRLPSVRPEPVYVFRWKDPSWRTGEYGRVAAMLEATIERIVEASSENAESLIVTEVIGEIDGQAVTLDDVELKLCTLLEGEFWMDSGRFDLDE